MNVSQYRPNTLFLAARFEINFSKVEWNPMPRLPNPEHSTALCQSLSDGMIHTVTVEVGRIQQMSNKGRML